MKAMNHAEKAKRDEVVVPSTPETTFDNRPLCLSCGSNKWIDTSQLDWCHLKQLDECHFYRDSTSDSAYPYVVNKLPQDMVHEFVTFLVNHKLGNGEKKPFHSRTITTTAEHLHNWEDC